MNTLTKGQTIAADMTGLGHCVVATYVGPVKVSAKYPQGGHRIRLLGRDKTCVVRRAPSPSDGVLVQMPAAKYGN